MCLYFGFDVVCFSWALCINIVCMCVYVLSMYVYMFPHFVFQCVLGRVQHVVELLCVSCSVCLSVKLCCDMFCCVGTVSYAFTLILVNVVSIPRCYLMLSLL